MRRWVYSFTLFAAVIIGLALLPVLTFMQSANDLPDNVFGHTTTSANLTISGSVQSDGAILPGAIISLSGSQTRTTTDANGNYVLSVSAGGNYTVTASKNGVGFSPASQTITNLQSNQTLNFVSGVPLCTPPPSGLVAWYRGENNALDSQGMNNATVFNESYLTGKVGQGFDFNGTNAYLEVADNPALSITGAIGLSAWIKPDVNSRQQVVMAKYAPNQASYYLGLNNNGTLRFVVYQNGGGSVFRGVDSTLAIPVNQLSHVTATFNPLTQEIYIYRDGVIMASPLISGSSNVTSIFDSTGKFYIGVAETDLGGVFFDGVIDEPQIYNRALSAPEIQSIYNAGSAGICAAGAVLTEASSLDSSFGTGGKVTTPFGTSFDIANAAVIQTDGKIVAVGYSSINSNNDFALARYNTDGSLDTSFGTGGKVTTSIGNSYEIATSVVIQTDGKIVAAGYSYNGSNEDFALVRYNTDGSLDTSFGTGGKTTTPIANANDEAYSAAIQPDGRIVVGGYSSNGSNNDFALVRYHTDGSLDTTFGTGGKVIMQFGSANDIIRAVVIQTDGKIVALGYFFNVSNNDFALARYNTDGSLDPSFGTNGKVSTAIGNSTDEIFSAVIQTNGKIVIAGCTNNGLNNDFALARYNADGSLDTSFGTGGKVSTPFGSSFDIANSVALQTDGKIVAAGFSRNPANEDFALARYNTDGSLDPSFGTGGKVTTQFGTSFEIAYAAAIQTDGKIVAVGYSRIGSTEDFALARYNADGSSGIIAANDVNISFSKITQSGNTVATPLTQSNLPALPNGYTLPLNAPMYDIRTSAVFSGSVNVQIKAANVTDAETCSRLRLLHFENGAWTTTTNAAPSYSGGTQICIVSQTVTSFSPFVVALESPSSFSYEADLQNRPFGDGFVDADDIQQIRNFSVGIGTQFLSNEFQRADCSPRSLSGDGFLDSDDVQQARRFAVGTDNNQIAGGPASGSVPSPQDLSASATDGEFAKSTLIKEKKSKKTAALKIGSQIISEGQTITVPVLVDTTGKEVGYTFSLNYDAAVLTNPQVAIGRAGGDVVSNTNTAGQIGFSITSFTGETIAPGTNQVLVNVTFTVAANVSSGTSRISFTDNLARRKTSGVDPNTLITQPTYTNGTITFGGGIAK